MVEELDLSPRVNGRAERPTSAVFVRDLTPDDIASLSIERGVKPPALQRLRDSHHALARSLAIGMRPGEASIITGYSLSRISILQADPAFQELLAFYRQDESKTTADFIEIAHSFKMDVLVELRDRFETDPDSFTNGTLREILKDLADRTGHGPSSKSTSINVNVSVAARLAAGRARADGARTPTDLPGSPVAYPLEPGAATAPLLLENDYAPSPCDDHRPLSDLDRRSPSTEIGPEVPGR